MLPPIDYHQLAESHSEATLIDHQATMATVTTNDGVLNQSQTLATLSNTNNSGDELFRRQPEVRRQ
jgi:hypothetical protein